MFTYPFRLWVLLLFLGLLPGCTSPVSGIMNEAESSVSVAEHQGSTDVSAETGDWTPATPGQQTTMAIPLLPSASPVRAPDSTPVDTPTDPGDISPTLLQVSDQAAAMLPEFGTDVQTATTWNQYVLAVTLIPDSLTVAGDMQVLVRNQEKVSFDDLYFHLYPNHEDTGGSLDVDNVQVNGQSVAVGTEQDGVLLRVDLNAPLMPGASAVVTLRFTARSQRNASGIVSGAFNYEAGVWSLATCYPVLARRFDGAWDRRPADPQGDLAVTETALYDVSIDTPPDLTLVTTGVRVWQEQLAHGPRRERFVSGPQRDFFLAALKGLDQASSVVDGTRIVSYYQPGSALSGQRSLTVTEQALRTFNARFGRYPLAELEVIQVPLTRFWGVEYPGVVLIEQSLYRRGGRDLDTTVAHEVGHQWWYSVVGNDAQGEAWLDEGLTSYTQVVYFEGLDDEARAEGELRRFRDQYRSARTAGKDAPLGQPVSDFQGNYVAIVYAKGALFFQALRVRLGDELFFRFLQHYYATYRYEEATGIDLLTAAESTCTCDLQPFYDDWVNEPVMVEIP